MFTDAIVIIATQWALYSILGTAFALSFRIGGFFDLSVGATFLVAGYAAWSLSHIVPVPVAAVGGVAVAVMFNVVVGKSYIAPLAARLPPLSLFVATIALLFLTQATVGLIAGEDSKVIRSGASPTLKILGLEFSDVQTALLIAAVSSLLGITWLLKRTSWGRAARAVSDDRDLADLIGLPVDRIILIAYVLCGALSGIAGVYFLVDRALDPAQAMAVLLSAMVATILGGESVAGASLGALLLAFLETSLGFAVQGYWRMTIVFTVLLAVMIWRQGGAFSLVNRRL